MTHGSERIKNAQASEANRPCSAVFQGGGGGWRVGGRSKPPPPPMRSGAATQKLSHTTRCHMEMAGFWSIFSLPK